MRHLRPCVSNGVCVRRKSRIRQGGHKAMDQWPIHPCLLIHRFESIVCSFINIPWRIHGAAIYGNMDIINIPLYVSINIPAPWILWVLESISIQFTSIASLYLQGSTARLPTLWGHWWPLLSQPDPAKLRWQVAGLVSSTGIHGIRRFPKTGNMGAPPNHLKLPARYVYDPV